MSLALHRYRELEDELVRLRWYHSGRECDEEDVLLDKMEAVWWNLEEGEREMLQAEPPRSPIRVGASSRPPRRLVDAEIIAAPNNAVRKIMEESA